MVTFSIIKAGIGGWGWGTPRSTPSSPNRLPLDDLEYTTMHELESRLAERWEPLPGATPKKPASAAR